MTPINKLPNYYAGKVYKRWSAITTLEGQGGFLATRIDKDKYIQLLITDKGKKKELLYSDGKIMDTIDIKGQKRTYLYRKDNTTNAIKGQMLTADQPDKEPPLVVAAKWISRNCMPERLFLKLNPSHKAAKVFIPAEKLPEGGASESFFGAGKRINVQEVLAKDFQNDYTPTPKTIILKNTNGTTDVVSYAINEEDRTISKQLDIESNVLGWKLRTMV